MATTITFVKGKRGSKNAVLDGYRFTTDRKRNGRTYMKCVQQIPVDPGSVDQVWSLLKPTLPSDMAEFIAYYERTWIGSSSTDPLFDHWLWSFGITMTRYLLAYHDPITLSKVGIMAFNSYLGVRIQIFGLF